MHDKRVRGGRGSVCWLHWEYFLLRAKWGMLFLTVREYPCFSNWDLDMVKEMKHKGKIRSCESLWLKSNYIRVLTFTCANGRIFRWDIVTNLAHTSHYIKFEKCCSETCKGTTPPLILCWDLVFIYFIHSCFIPVGHYGGIAQKHSTSAYIFGVSKRKSQSWLLSGFESHIHFQTT